MRLFLGKIDGWLELFEIPEKNRLHYVLKLCKQPKTNAVIKLKRLQWLGYIERMTNNRATRKIARIVRDDRRKRVRPRKR